MEPNQESTVDVPTLVCVLDKNHVAENIVCRRAFSCFEIILSQPKFCSFSPYSLK
jgi:hypothetical protein